jgi:hypothetical protein
LVDRHDAGRATDAGAGILSPETLGGSAPPFLDLADLAGDHYRALVGALAEVGAPDPRYDECGALRVAFREIDDEHFAAVFAWEYQGNGQSTAPKLHREPLHFETVHLTQRSYK